MNLKDGRHGCGPIKANNIIDWLKVYNELTKESAFMKLRRFTVLAE
jgi:hypothetical protein